MDTLITKAFNKFIGTWKLIEAIEFESQEKAFYPWGDDAQGYIMYTKEGIMAVQIIPREPLNTPSEITNHNCLQNYNIYCGPFEVNETNNLVIHHVQAHVDPAMVGRKNIRSYTFYDDKLLLITQGEPTTRRLLWQKV